MFNILPQIDNLNVLSWEQVVTLCVHMICETVLIIALFLVLYCIVKLIINLLCKHCETKRQEEILRIIKENDNNEQQKSNQENFNKKKENKK